MELTFLGHQSWLISHKETHILIDPILADRFGSNDGIEIYPPRTIDIAGMPAISAIFLSHEHSDHVHLPSLERLPRNIEVVVGDNMLAVVVDAISSLGFTVRRQSPFKPFRLGDLQATFYPASDDTVFWESRVNQFLVCPPDRERAAVFIAVDALVAHEYLEEVASGVLPTPLAVAVSNNSQITPTGVFGSLDNLTDLKGAYAKKGLFGLRILSALLIDYLQGLEGCKNVLICGGGFMKGYPELGPFPFSDQSELADSVNAFSRSLRVCGPYPGQRYVVCDDLEPMERAPYVAIDQDRFARLRKQSADFIAEKRSIDMIRVTQTPFPVFDVMAARIDAALQRMVVALMLSSLGQSMISMKEYLEGPLGPYRMAVCLLSDDGVQDTRWVLDVVSARFVRIPSGTLNWNELLVRYPYGITAYLSDVYAVVQGELQIWDIAGVALRAWYLGAAESSPVAFLYSWFGEHLNPALYEKQYRKKVADLGYPWRNSQSAAPRPEISIT